MAARVAAGSAGGGVGHSAELLAEQQRQYEEEIGRLKQAAANAQASLELSEKERMRLQADSEQATLSLRMEVSSLKEALTATQAQLQAATEARAMAATHAGAAAALRNPRRVAATRHAAAATVRRRAADAAVGAHGCRSRLREAILPGASPPAPCVGA